jgi:hypothetical protein
MRAFLRRNPAIQIVCLAVGIPLGLSGCGSNGTISGKITYQGETLRGGTIIFASQEDKGSVVAEIGNDGTYTIEKVPSGKVKIVVETSSLAKRARIPSHSAPDGQKMPGGGSSDLKARYVPIPAQYESFDSTPLTYEVKSGKHQFNITLEGTAVRQPIDPTDPEALEHMSGAGKKGSGGFKGPKGPGGQ